LTLFLEVIGEFEPQPELQGSSEEDPCLPPDGSQDLGPWLLHIDSIEIGHSTGGLGHLAQGPEVVLFIIILVFGFIVEPSFFGLIISWDHGLIFARVGWLLSFLGYLD